MRKQKLGKQKTLEMTNNLMIADSIEKASSILPNYERISCSVSGGKDSDIMLDLLWNLDPDNKITYVWMNTGLEYQATIDHLDFLEEKYDIEIKRLAPVKPIPQAAKEYGQPFLSKIVSENIHRLQLNGFNWKDESYEDLIKKYPRCKSALRWWCNCHKAKGGRKVPAFNIEINAGLKEFLMTNPPTFKVSNKCCAYSKKMSAHAMNSAGNFEIQCVGIRKGEGGARANRYKNCFDHEDGKIHNYRPLFWYTSADEAAYDETFGTTHSDCYTVWGLTRTGCVGCPYNRKIGDEIEIMRYYEPKKAKAAEYIFRDSYEYTRQYREFAAKMNTKEKQVKGQISIFDFKELTNDTERG